MMDITVPTKGAATALEAARTPSRLWKHLLEVITFLLLVLPLAVCEYGLEPFRRGFFCDDSSLHYPFQEESVTNGTLGLIVTIPPLIVIILGEFHRHRLHCNNYCQQQGSSDRQLIYECRWRGWILNCLRLWLEYCFGLLLTFDAIEVSKYASGRLRPHFMAVCQPHIADGSTCRNVSNQCRYIEDYYCANSVFTASDVRQARLSFPSGHAGLTFYCMTFLTLYLQMRSMWRQWPLVRHLAQFLCILSAWFTAFSRITDYWHHWSDVLAGSLLGFWVAILTSLYISRDMNRPLSNLTEGNNACKGAFSRQDTTLTLNEMLETVESPPVQHLPTTELELYSTKF